MIPPIQSIIAREILDSRGMPTIEADILLEGGARGRASVPSGASTGQFEAIELRDTHRPDRFMGKGVLTAITNVKTIIAPALQGKVFENQEVLDQRLCQLDGTENKSHLGANGILAVSLAYARAQSAHCGVPLYQRLNTSGCFAPTMPVPMMNVINGGAHADNPLSVQEFMIIPYGFPLYADALRAGVEIFYVLKSRLKQMGLSVNVGDEGGFAPALPGTQKTLDILLEAIHEAGYKAGSQVALGLDVAASTLFRQGRYHFPEERFTLTSEELVRFYEQLVRSYPLLSLEDGMEETDFDGWALLTQALGGSVQLVGDDVFVTNPKLFQQGIDKGIANAILVKVNQIGTLTEAMTTITMAKDAGYGAIISHRSGETEDTFIADLAVASGVGQIKTGSLSRSDRVAKYNQLLRIEELSAFPYAGAKAFAPSLIERFLS